MPPVVYPEHPRGSSAQVPVAKNIIRYIPRIAQAANAPIQGDVAVGLQGTREEQGRGEPASGGGVVRVGDLTVYLPRPTMHG